jgi:cytochrome P450
MNSREDERLGEIFNPFRDPYLADPYAFFADARSTTPVFHSPLIKYWVVTRHRDIRQIFESPKLFSAANALSPIQPPCAEARRLLSAGRRQPCTHPDQRRSTGPYACAAAGERGL